MTNYGFIDDYDPMEQQDMLFDQGRTSLLDDPEDLTDDLDLLLELEEDMFDGLDDLESFGDEDGEVW